MSFDWALYNVLLSFDGRLIGPSGVQAMCSALLVIIEEAEPLKQGLQHEHAGHKQP
jgi:hypothetical protein